MSNPNMQSNDEMAKESSSSKKNIMSLGEFTEVLDHVESNESFTEDQSGLEEEEADPAIASRLRVLKSLQSQKETIDAQYRHERIALENRFQAKYQTLFRQRAGILSGEIYVSSNQALEDGSVARDAVEHREGEEREEEGEEGGGDRNQQQDQQQDQQGVPSFWLQAMLHHPTVSEMITEEDVEALDFLTNVECSVSEDLTSFSLAFHFDSRNPFFANPCLSKTYLMVSLIDPEAARMVVGCQGSDIEWRPGKDLTVELVAKKQRAKSGRKAGQVRTVQRSVPKPSFFNYFNIPRILMLTPDSHPETPEEEEEMARMEQELETDVDISEVFRTELVPNVYLWFTGEALMQPGEGEEEEEEGSFGDASFYEDIEDDEGEEEQAGRLQRHQGKSRLPTLDQMDGEGGGAEGAEGQECKQS